MSNSGTQTVTDTIPQCEYETLIDAWDESGEGVSHLVPYNNDKPTQRTIVQPSPTVLLTDNLSDYVGLNTSIKPDGSLRLNANYIPFISIVDKAITVS